ncbi:hypothetical protein AURDEDRAFT_176883 [Auricularia subglabra TFB-10046 SS5]|uniref:Uncharacterized protein n=1 Tax=Auricularia subglabra (strain TFB-10046 / SS5) TaxID=717982 RepID=J0CUQ0_AURST|nr:hypothetical protein AURDEDRAFT_176883 [Auricularia subglabra TFB-10046 SS5]
MRGVCGPPSSLAFRPPPSRPPLSSPSPLLSLTAADDFGFPSGRSAALSTRGFADAFDDREHLLSLTDPHAENRPLDPRPAPFHVRSRLVTALMHRSIAGNCWPDGTPALLRTSTRPPRRGCVMADLIHGARSHREPPPGLNACTCTSADVPAPALSCYRETILWCLHRGRDAATAGLSAGGAAVPGTPTGFCMQIDSSTQGAALSIGKLKMRAVE